MMTASLLATGVSAILLVLLGVRDPKRLRNLRRDPDGKVSTTTLNAPVRRAFGWLALLPGVVLGVMSLWWAFLIWMGATTAIGWVVAQVLVSRSPRHRDIAAEG